MPTPDPEARPLHRLHHLIREQYLRLVEVGSTPPTEEELLALFSELYRLTAPMVEPAAAPEAVPAQVPDLALVEYWCVDGTGTFMVLEGSTSLGEFPTREAAESFLEATRAERKRQEKLQQAKKLQIAKKYELPSQGARAWYQRRESSTVGEMFDVYEGSRLVHTYFTPEAAQAAVTQRNQALRAAAKSSRYWSVDLSATADEGFVQYAVYDRDTRLATFPNQAEAEAYLARLQSEEEQQPNAPRGEDPPTGERGAVLKWRAPSSPVTEFKFDPSLFLNTSALSWE